MTDRKTPDLETAMQQLEALVTQMESGELSLEASLATFKKGIELGKQCQQALDKAEQQVRILNGNDNQAPLANFNDGQPVPNNPPAASGFDNNFSSGLDDNTPSGFDDNIPF